MQFSDHWWTEFRWLVETIFAEHDGNTYFEITLVTSFYPFLLYLSFEFSGRGWGRVFFFKFELIPLWSQSLAYNNSPLKHEQWEKKMLSSLPFPLTHPSGCGSSFTSYLRTSGDHSSHSQPASLWHIYYNALMESFSIFYNWTPQPDFNCLRHRPQHNIYRSDLAGIQPLADYSWLPQSFTTI